jgi:hypothetical protein
MAGVLAVIWGSGEAEYFRGRDWTGQIMLKSLHKIAFWRAGNSCSATSRANAPSPISTAQTVPQAALRTISCQPILQFPPWSEEVKEIRNKRDDNDVEVREYGHVVDPPVISSSVGFA